MMINILIALAAGCASALMFVSIVSGALISLLLFYLAPLPLMVAALGWGPVGAAIGGLLGAVGLAAIVSFPYALAFIVTIVIPACWLGHLALLARPAEVETDPPTLEWFPVGRLVAWMAGFAALTTMAALLTLGTDGTTINDGLRTGLQRALSTRNSADADRLIDALVTVAPPAAATVAMLTLTLNLWLAGKITATSGRLTRPWPDLRTTTLPAMTLAVLSLALGLSFLGGVGSCWRGGGGRQVRTRRAVRRLRTGRRRDAAHADADRSPSRFSAELDLCAGADLSVAGHRADRARARRRRLRPPATLFPAPLDATADHHLTFN